MTYYQEQSLKAAIGVFVLAVVYGSFGLLVYLAATEKRADPTTADWTPTGSTQQVEAVVHFQHRIRGLEESLRRIEGKLDTLQLQTLKAER